MSTIVYVCDTNEAKRCLYIAQQLLEPNIQPSDTGVSSFRFTSIDLIIRNVNESENYVIS